MNAHGNHGQDRDREGLQRSSRSEGLLIASVLIAQLAPIFGFACSQNGRVQAAGTATDHVSALLLQNVASLVGQLLEVSGARGDLEASLNRIFASVPGALIAVVGVVRATIAAVALARDARLVLGGAVSDNLQGATPLSTTVGHGALHAHLSLAHVHCIRARGGIGREVPPRAERVRRAALDARQLRRPTNSVTVTPGGEAFGTVTGIAGGYSSIGITHAPAEDLTPTIESVVALIVGGHIVVADTAGARLLFETALHGAGASVALLTLNGEYTLVAEVGGTRNASQGIAGFGECHLQDTATESLSADCKCNYED